MQLYNSMTRKKETFTPVREGKVAMYVCGITAYDLCHIGHARSALVFDVLVRYLRHKGLEVNFIRNFTDVDDKIITRAHHEQRDWREVAETYIQAFHEDMDRLGILRATAEPRATDYIQEMQALCQKLIAEGKAYATLSGDVYFRVRTFEGYGKLSGRSLDELQAGARVAVGEEKEDPLDFALWKAAKAGEPSWDSPWGQGRPGWHIECSAMNADFLPLDIHGGGLDLIFPHHENEIAQSEAATGKELARYWVHNGFVQVDSEKMSKSLGNFKTIRDILQHYLPESLRFFLLSKHYRSPIDFTDQSMDEAEKGQKRVYECLQELEKSLQRAQWKKIALPEDVNTEFTALTTALDEALDDDCNTASALGHIFGLVRLANRLMEDKSLRAAEGTRDLLVRLQAVWTEWAQVLGLFEQQPSVFLDDLRRMRAERKGIDTSVVAAVLQERQEARKNKDFARSDTLREQCTAMGIDLRDTPEGPVWDIL
ncbi:MAG: cysteine--tRNA ligase [Desulfovibrionaceae bacterium]